MSLPRHYWLPRHVWLGTEATIAPGDVRTYRVTKVPATTAMDVQP